MKLLLIITSILLLGGCASVSEYGQGCRDGVGMMHPFEDYHLVAEHCDRIEEMYRHGKVVERLGSRR